MEKKIITEQLQADFDKGLHTEQEFHAALKSVVSYGISYAIYEVLLQCDRMNTELRNHRLCTRTGFKKELNDTMNVVQRLRVSQRIVLSGDYDRVTIMAKETHEYQTKTIQQMYWSAQNFLSFKKFAEAGLMASLMVTMGITQNAIDIVDSFVPKITEFQPEFASCLGIRPLKLRDSIMALMQRVEQLVGEADFDVNDCTAIHTGKDIMTNTIFDTHLMYLHCSFSLEQTNDAEWFKRECPECNEILHPNYQSA